MKHRSHKTGIAILNILTLLMLTLITFAQDDPSSKSPPGEKAQNTQEQIRQDGAEVSEKGLAQTQQQVQKKDKKKNEEETKKDVKEVKSTNPDMKKGKGARPPYISRPSGSGKPQGAGKPAGAVKPGRR
jgi:hypothetical protein